MTRKTSLFPLALILLCFPAFSHAQLWSGILAPSRAIDWSRAGVEGGIPNRTTVCSALSSGASASQINSAINACPAGQVVFLNAGTYNLSGMIDFNNNSDVTLRGAGADKTFLVFSAGGSCRGLSADICVDNGDTNYSGGPSNTASWTGGYGKGTTSITLSSTANLSVGNALVLDQLNDSSDTGNVWVCAATNVCSNDGPGGAARNNRDQQQLVTVTGISGNTVTISPGLYMPNWRGSQSPGAWWATSVVKNDGVEDLSITNASGANGVVMFNALNCWVKGIRSLSSSRNHVWLYVSAHITITGSYFHGTQSSASQSYGVETFGSSDNLIENNIFQAITAPMMGNGSESGTVWGYNFSINDLYTVSSNWMQPASYLHAAGTDNVLFEGNEDSGLIADQVHGTHNFITAFRNQLIGWESGKNNQTVAVQLYTGARYFNIVGNVLGKSGYHNNYQDVTPSGTNGNTSIFTLGWSGNGGATDGCCVNDSLVVNSLMRWGNYDVVNNAIRFLTSEVPSGLGQFASLLPSSQVLTASFYNSSKPSWWSSMPWPAIGPDVSGGNVANVGGHAYMNPAMACYTNVMGGPSNGSGSALSFNANSCYGSGSTSQAPAPPTGLSATVQ